ncbi:hypothetical protein LX36DRAFT_337741 [Colletotrichum falcatum]|nr:hypothetical protein LX36DRAFT_337741 [Colletotrichum falcatum]
MRTYLHLPMVDREHRSLPPLERCLHPSSRSFRRSFDNSSLWGGGGFSLMSRRVRVSESYSTIHNSMKKKRKRIIHKKDDEEEKGEGKKRERETRLKKKTKKKEEQRERMLSGIDTTNQNSRLDRTRRQGFYIP